MHLFFEAEPGVLEVRYTWLPSFIGLNTQLLNELAVEAGKVAVGRPLDEALFHELDTLAVGIITKRLAHGALPALFEALLALEVLCSVRKRRRPSCPEAWAPRFAVQPSLTSSSTEGS